MAQGRIGTVIALVVAPIIVNTAIQLATKPGWQLGLRLGIWIAVASAFAPMVYLLALVGLLAMAAMLGARLRFPALIAAIIPGLLLGPWMIDRVFVPMRWWWEAGYASGYAASIWDIALGRAGGPGAAPAWLSVGVLLLGLLALLPAATRWAVGVAWGFALFGLAVAAAGSFSTFTTPSSSNEVQAWVGIPVVLWIGGLSAAAMIAADGMATSAEHGRQAIARPAVIALVVAGLFLPVGTGAWWLVRGQEDPLTRGRLTDVPAFLTSRPGSTLVIDGKIAGGIDYRVLEKDGLKLGQEAVLSSEADAKPVTDLVGRILSNPDANDLTRLAGFGVGAIYAPSVDPELARRLDAAPGLEPAGSEDPDSRVWTLPQKPAVAGGSGSVLNPVIAGVQILLWVVAIILTAPVRQRRRSHEAQR